MSGTDGNPPRRSRPAGGQAEAGQQAMPPASWAKRTGFKGRISGESITGDSGPLPLGRPPKVPDVLPDLEAGRPPRPAPPSSTPLPPNGEAANRERPSARTPEDDQPPRRKKSSNSVVAADSGAAAVAGKGSGANGSAKPDPPPPPPSKPRREDEPSSLPQVPEEEEDLVGRRPHINYDIRDAPGLVPIPFYGLQHNLSMLGSIVLIPLVLVPAMGGTYENTSAVVSTVLFVSGLTTLLNSLFGSRLPLVQGPSFVYLAPALAMINSTQFLELTENRFRHIMRALQGSIIISSAFQALIGYSGLASVCLRLINPVVVSPTIAAVGLSFFSYGFTRVGMCLEIGLLQLLLVVVFSLYLRRISVFGHRVFLIYAVPLSLGITWAVAFLLTEVGAYSYGGCDPNVPTSNAVSDYCRRHVPRMKHCRADTSHALRSSPWFRLPFPLQWGIPIFDWKMVLVMCAASLVASIDSVGSYHASSLLVAARPPTAGVLSRGIGMEGISGVLAGLWGSGSSSSTLTENVHTIAVTKMGSRRAVQVGAVILIVLSFVGKVGGFIASIPDVVAGALLCFMWAMMAALGLSNLRYSEAGSSRNIIIVGLSLFFALSVPAYVQQFGTLPGANTAVPSYFLPYTAASRGPLRTGFQGVNYVVNTLLSLHMVVAFVISAVLDNTVPGSKQERGVYIWSEPDSARRDTAVLRDYQLPFKVGRPFRWVRWVGL